MAQVGGIGSIVGGAIFAVVWFRRWISKEKLESLKDRTEGQMLNESRAERDKALTDAREAWKQLNSQQFQQGQLTAENAFLKRELADLREEMAAIRSGVQAVGRSVDRTKAKLDSTDTRLVNSGFAPLSQEKLN